MLPKLPSGSGDGWRFSSGDGVVILRAPPGRGPKVVLYDLRMFLAAYRVPTLPIVEVDSDQKKR